jgi:hypothetical protein
MDEYSVAPFAVTLSEWSIIPHVEAMDSSNIFGTKATTRSKARIATTTTPEKEELLETDDNEIDDSSPSSTTTTTKASFRRSDRQAAWSRHLRTRNLSPDELKTQQLIASEELIGRVKQAERRAKQRLKEEALLRANQGLEPLNETRAALVEELTPPPPLPLPLDEWEEFNGPCVICLEPDTASRERLQAVRYLLKHGLSGGVEWAELYSPTSSVTHPKLVRTTVPLSTTTRRGRRGRGGGGGSSRTTLRDDDDPSEFRPVVPIAAFPTVASAIPVARKLRQLWQPLTFSVTDLHVLSSAASSSGTNTVKDSEPDEPDDLLDEYYQRKSFASAVPSVPKEKTGSGVGSPPRTTATTETNQFGCDALIALVGAEMEMDEELNQQMAHWICTQGEEGGFARQASSNSTTAADVVSPDLDEVLREGWTENLDKWLRDEDDYDEGTVVVIGRTQLFTGEMRQYVGMPASSALDA